MKFAFFLIIAAAIVAGLLYREIDKRERGR